MTQVVESKVFNTSLLRCSSPCALQCLEMDREDNIHLITNTFLVPRLLEDIDSLRGQRETPSVSVFSIPQVDVAPV